MSVFFMSNSDILKKAIEKAVDNGWDELEDFNNLPWERELRDPSRWIEIDASGHIEILWGDSYGVYSRSLNDIIFSHSFAKSFWGERRVCENEGHPIKKCICSTEFGGIVTFPAWQYHLQQLVLAEDRLAYLEKFL